VDERNVVLIPVAMLVLGLVLPANSANTAGVVLRSTVLAYDWGTANASIPGE